MLFFARKILLTMIMKMRRIFILFYCLFIFNYLVGQTPDTTAVVPVDTTATMAPGDTSYWSAGGLNTITFSQVYLSPQWAAGGQSSVAVNGAVGLFADYKKARNSWENSLDIGYGQLGQDRDQDGDLDFLKSDDKINFVTKYGYQIKNKSTRWFFSALLDFRTQFAKGFSAEDMDSVISRFMAPGYLTIGLGVDYKPNKKLSFNYVPLTGKFTFVNDQRLANLGAYGVDSGRTHRSELGSFLRIKVKTALVKNVNIDSRLELFTNYVENFGNIDVNWQNNIVMKINKIITANISTNLIYDDDIKFEIDENNDNIVDAIGPRIQFKNVFSLGLSFNFGATRDE